MGHLQNLGAMAGRNFSCKGHRVGRTEQYSGFRHVALEMMRAVTYLLDKTRVVAQITLVVGLVMLLGYALDREPPFRVLSVEPAAAYPGDMVTIRAHVWRDMDRDCSVSWSRFLFAPGVGRVDIASATAGASLVRRLERLDPGRLTITIQVPPTATAGQATLATELDYACNKFHSLVWPIHVEADFPFTVLPYPSLPPVP